MIHYNSIFQYFLLLTSRKYLFLTVDFWWCHWILFVPIITSWIVNFISPFSSQIHPTLHLSGTLKFPAKPLELQRKFIWLFFVGNVILNTCGGLHFEIRLTIYPLFWSLADKIWASSVQMAAILKRLNIAKSKWAYVWIKKLIYIHTISVLYLFIYLFIYL